jgi:hypothetical protein
MGIDVHVPADWSKFIVRQCRRCAEWAVSLASPVYQTA